MAQRTLLLTSWYLPIRILPWQEAVKRIYEGRVDVLVEYDEELRSPSVTWKMPAVIRLRRNVVRHRNVVKFSRANVYQRDQFTCQYCGQRFVWAELTYDHLVPRSRGGKTNFLNIVSACRPCNARKGSRTCDEAGMFPLQPPVAPKALSPAASLAGSGNVPEEWEPFLAPYAVG